MIKKLTAFTTILLALSSPISAQVLDLGGVLGGNQPFRTEGLPEGCYEDTLLLIIRNGLVIFIALLFIGIVFTIASITLRYVSSGGNADEIQGATNSVRNILSAAFFLLIVLLFIYGFGSAFIQNWDSAVVCETPASGP